MTDQRLLLSQTHNEIQIGLCAKIQRMLFLWWDGLTMFSFAGGNYKLNRTKQNKEPSCCDKIKDLQGLVIFMASIALFVLILRHELKFVGQVKTSRLEQILLPDQPFKVSESLNLVFKTSFNTDDLLSLVRNSRTANNFLIPRQTGNFKESDWKSVEEYVCSFESVSFLSTRLNSSHLELNEFKADCLLDTWATNNEIGAVFLFAVGKQIDSFSGSRNLQDLKTKAWSNATEVKDFILSSQDRSKYSIDLKFANELQGVRLRHELIFTQDKDPALFSGWKFKSNQEWQNFKQSANASELAVINSYKNFYGEVKESIFQVELIKKIAVDVVTTSSSSFMTQEQVTETMKFSPTLEMALQGGLNVPNSLVLTSSDVKFSLKINKFMTVSEFSYFTVYDAFSKLGGHLAFILGIFQQFIMPVVIIHFVLKLCDVLKHRF